MKALPSQLTERAITTPLSIQSYFIKEIIGECIRQKGSQLVIQRELDGKLSYFLFEGMGDIDLIEARMFQGSCTLFMVYLRMTVDEVVTASRGMLPGEVKQFFLTECFSAGELARLNSGSYTYEWLPARAIEVTRSK